MKKRIFIFLMLAVCSFNLQISAQTNFNNFWTKLKTAVRAKDKTAVAGLTKFPLSMPYGQASVKSKAQLSARYSEIFDGEADAVKCFVAEKPQLESKSRYFVSCGFKNDKSGEAGKPIVYSFELTKTGWRFTGLDNINE
jgi:hypothetical protein